MGGVRTDDAASDGVADGPGRTAQREPDEDVLLARAYLSRVAEPTCIPLWRDVCRYGPVAVAEAIRAGDIDADLRRATVSRATTTDPHQDLETAARHGIRLLTPEMDSWPHAAFACLEATALRRLDSFRAGHTAPAPSGELVPPVALWARGAADLSTAGFRSVAIVGARACTQYGELVTKQLAYGLATRNFEIVSGGAFGIDAAAHRACLAAGGRTLLVSAGGIDAAYPLAHRGLFDQVAESGVVLSESPPGSAPQRRRFLTRNRLVAALATGTVVVEAAGRSGAINTAAHCRDLGRVLMSVPGPVTSGLSVGCHQLVTKERFAARLITGADDVVAEIGSASDVAQLFQSEEASRSGALSELDSDSRQILDGLPSRGSIGLDSLAITSGVPVATIIERITALEIDGYVRRTATGFALGERRPG